MDDTEEESDENKTNEPKKSKESDTVNLGDIIQEDVQPLNELEGQNEESKSKTSAAREDSKPKIPEYREDSKAKISVSPEDTKSKTSTAREDSKARLSTPREDSKARVSVSPEDTKSKTSTAREDSKARLSTPREDSKARVSVSPEDSKSKTSAVREDSKVSAVSKVSASPEDSKSKTSAAREDSKARISGAREDSKSKLSGSREDSKVRISGAREDSKVRISGAREDSKAETPEFREDTITKIPESLEESEAKESIYPEPKSGYEPGVSTVPHEVANNTARYAAFNCSALLQKRNPFIHDPPQPEERRPRVNNPRCPREYLINLREDLADFQESHGLPRTRDYSFLSLGLALAQETARAICSLFFMFVELFPILAIVSLILRFALDKIIEILETTDCTEKVKKSVIFAIQMLMIIIPLWIFIGTIILPLVALIFSIFRRVFRVQKGKCNKPASIKPKQNLKTKEKQKKIDCFFLK